MNMTAANSTSAIAFSIDSTITEKASPFTEENLTVNNEFINKLWFEDVLASKVDAKFSIMHLNINSLFSKFVHVKKILDTEMFELVALNETKIDQFVKNDDIDHDCYDILRRDRNRHGGGILVYYKKTYQIVESIIDEKYELIYMKLIIEKKTVNFIITYKPPTEKICDYLGYLEEFILRINLNYSTFLIGDLNLDLSSDKGGKLKDFMQALSLMNCVKELTPEVRDSNTGKISSYLIDVILHNNDDVLNTNTVDFPYSDHKIVIANFNFKTIAIAPFFIVQES